MRDARAPDYAEAVEAWRLWLVVQRGDLLRLRSVIYHAEWIPGEALVAECLHGRRLWKRPWRTQCRTHAAPNQPCRCGIYALEDPTGLRSYLSGYPVRDSLRRVVGRVALWGRVAESKQGWRASRAYPLKLYVPAAPGACGRREADAVAAGLTEYGVPTQVVAYGATPALLEALAAACGGRLTP